MSHEVNCDHCYLLSSSPRWPNSTNAQYHEISVVSCKERGGGGAEERVSHGKLSERNLKRSTSHHGDELSLW